MTDTPDQLSNLSRRRMLGVIGLAPVTGVLLGACGGDNPAAESASSTTAATGAPATSTTEATAATTTTAQAAPSNGGWASGGTDLITVAYPDDSIFDSANTCSVSLMPSTTEGPCYFHSDTEEDISTGKQGLPMQLCVQVIDEDCTPLADHVVEVWHCDERGTYSGDTDASSDASRFAGDFCTGGDAEAESATYYRGQRTTDSNGRANFKTCFPGWYRGRTIHIHFAISDASGDSRVISQWCFNDEFAEEICTTHPLYSGRGAQDTPLSGGSDTVFPSSGYEDFMLDLQANDDGSLLAYSVVKVS